MNGSEQSLSAAGNAEPPWRGPSVDAMFDAFCEHLGLARLDTPPGARLSRAGALSAEQAYDLAFRPRLARMPLPMPACPESGWPGAVYFIRAGDDLVVKIGYTSGDVRSRVASMQTAHHRPLRIVDAVCGSVELEQWFHAAFASLRVRGEWFRCVAELRFFLFCLAHARRTP